MRFRSIMQGRHRRLFVQLVTIGLSQALLTVGIALLIRLSFDRFIMSTGSSSLQQILFVIIGLVVAAVCTSWLRMRERVDAEKLGQDVIHQIRLNLFKHLTKLAPRALQRRSRGSIVLRFVGDLNAIKRWVSLGLARILVAGVTIAGTFLALSIINWVMATGVLMVIAVTIFCIFRLGRQIQETVKEGRRRRSFLASNINEKIASMAVVQIFGQSVRERKRLRRQSNRLKYAMIARAEKIGLLRAIIQSAIILATGTALFLGAFEITVGRASPGTIVAFLTIVGLLFPALRDLGRVYEYWHDAQISYRKIKQFHKTPSLVTETPGSPDLRAESGRLVFSEVSLFGSVKRFSAVAEHGQIIGITGPNGAGKSTLLLLAARLLDPDEGRILLNGQDIAKHSIASVRLAIGMVSPDLPLLRGKIDKNLRYRRPDAPVEEIRRIKTLCKIDRILSNLPDGDQTRLTDEGLNLSLGQRQQIALARALLGNPAILLLDEADAHLDHDARKVLDRVILDFQGTILMVTHNPQNLPRVDVIWKMQNGRLVEAGPPQVVLQYDKSIKSLKTIHAQ